MDFDNPETWKEIAEMPQGVDTVSFQRKINSVCGLNPFGQPNVLLTWMPAPENYSKYFCEWDTAGFGTKTRLVAQYVFETVHGFEIPPPRWALKQFLHPSRYIASEPVVRWKTMQVGQQVLLRENRPPRSDKGIYVKLISIGRHDQTCCRRQKGRGLTCYGLYREPDESYLTLLRKAVAERDATESQNPNEPITIETLNKAALEAANEIKSKKEKEEEKTLGFVTENLDKLVAQFTGDKSFINKKEFSFPTKTTESGLIIPL